LKKLKDQLVPLRERFVALIDEDAAAFQKVLAAYKLPKMTAAERQERAEAISAALQQAAATPFRTMTLALEVLKLARPIVEYGNKNSISDAGVATLNLAAAVHGGRLNVLINLSGVKDDEFVKEKMAALEQLTAAADSLVKEYLNIVTKRLT